MLFRGEVRCTAVYLLQYALEGNGATVTSSRDTPVQAGKPILTRSVEVYVDDKKTGTGTAPPQFRTDVLTVIEINIEGRTKDEAEALNDTFCEIIENTLLNGGSLFVKHFEMIDNVDSRPAYRAIDSKRHLFSTVIEISAHATEIFEPTVTDNLAGVNIYVDSVNMFDPSGTYEPPFDYPINDEPRTAGPDGRVEISGTAELNQEQT